MLCFLQEYFIIDLILTSVRLFRAIGYFSILFFLTGKQRMLLPGGFIPVQPVIPAFQPEGNMVRGNINPAEEDRENSSTILHAAVGCFYDLFGRNGV